MSVQSECRTWFEVDSFSGQIPNFAMDTTDVDPNADRAQERFLIHVFDQPLELAAGPSGSAVYVPPDMSIWPTAALFDAVYASAVMHHFGFALVVVLKKWEDVFYPGGPTKAVHVDDKRRRDQADADKENSSKTAQQKCYNRRDRRRGIHGAIDPYDVVMMCRFQAMEPDKVRSYLQGCEEMVAARERKGLEEKINSWRESLDR